MWRAGQRPQSPPLLQPASGDYAFLVGLLIDQHGLDHAAVEAARCGVATHEVLLASGQVAQSHYAAALADRLGVPVVHWNCVFERDAEGGLRAFFDGQSWRVLSATRSTPRELAGEIAALRRGGVEIALAPQAMIDAVLAQRGRRQHADRAVRGLLRARPESSAGARGPLWQTIAGATLAGFVIGGLAVLPHVTIGAATVLLSLPFLCITLLRMLAFHEVLAGRGMNAARSRSRLQPLSDQELPIYTVMVPLLREANVLPDLIEGLRALDYPSAKLEVFLVLEASDGETQAALLSIDLPGNFRTIVVPDCLPRTKPKALNYALQFARGSFLVVYDAEDRPEPDQLRRALDAFRHGPRRLGCLQARLNIDNAWQSWLTRQFTIEYSVLFDAILPALERLRLPVPLGGTSNHFPRAVLDEIGGWDPFNVTEDADLGIRLARRGYSAAVLASTTWEEAPVTYRVWLGQRTRWLKGWMQTYLVHTRQPWRLNAELGLRASIGFHTLMGGLVASALVHPLFYLLIAYHWLSGELLQPAESTAGAAVWTIAWINLAIGYGVSILVGMLSVVRRGRPGLALHALLMPVYWLLISFAAYRALAQLVRTPYLWEKTAHGSGVRSRG